MRRRTESLSISPARKNETAYANRQTPLLCHFFTAIVPFCMECGRRGFIPIFSFDFPKNRDLWLSAFLPVLLLGLSACGGGGSSGFSSDGTGDGDVLSASPVEQNTSDSNTTPVMQNAVDSSMNSADPSSDNSNINTQNANLGKSSTPQAFSFPSKAKVSKVSSAVWEAAKSQASAPDFQH